MSDPFLTKREMNDLIAVFLDGSEWVTKSYVDYPSDALGFSRLQARIESLGFNYKVGCADDDVDFPYTARLWKGEAEFQGVGETVREAFVRAAASYIFANLNQNNGRE